MSTKKDLLSGYKQHAPFMVEIEPTEGCNLGCSFCGLRGIRENGTKPWKTMSVEDANEIAIKVKESGWNSRICFAGHGEPTINPNLLEIIKVFRKHLPKNKMQLICNGYGFKHGNFDIKEFLSELKSINFNDVVFDVYSENGDWTAIEEVLDEYPSLPIIGRGGEPFNYDKKGMRVALYPTEVDSRSKIIRIMDNHCGAAAPQDYSEKVVSKRCEKPFRYLTFRWNGLVCLCCDDFRGQYRIGNISEFDKIEDLWNHPAFQAIRIMLLSEHHRKMKPCYGCNYHSIRPGLLPDPSGRDKDKMPVNYNDEVESVIKKHYFEEGSTTIVKRKWEK